MKTQNQANGCEEQDTVEVTQRVKHYQESQNRRLLQNAQHQSEDDKDERQEHEKWNGWTKEIKSHREEKCNEEERSKVKAEIEVNERKRDTRGGKKEGRDRDRLHG